MMSEVSKMEVVFVRDNCSVAPLRKPVATHTAVVAVQWYAKAGHAVLEALLLSWEWARPTGLATVMPPAQYSTAWRTQVPHVHAEWQ